MNQEREKDLALINDALNTLIEHFDSVQIFVSRHEEAVSNGTITLQNGRGNWFTRYGQIKQWIIRSDESARIEERNPIE